MHYHQDYYQIVKQKQEFKTFSKILFSLSLNQTWNHKTIQSSQE